VSLPAPSPAPPPRLGPGAYALHLWVPWSLALSNVLLGVAVLAALPRRLWALRRDARALAPLGLYVLGLLVSIVASYEPRASLRSASEIFSLATFPLALVWARGERQVRRLIDGVVIAAALCALFGLWQYFVGDYGGIDRRIRGPFSHYMTFAGVLLLADLLLLARLACGSGWRAPWRWAALVAINLALMGSLTRSAWVGLLLALTVLLVVRAPRALLLYLPAAAVLVVVLPVPLLQRALSIADLHDTSNYDRLCMARAGLQMVAERPLFGLGPQLVERRYPIYRHATAPRYNVPHLHNSLLQLAAERGLVSLAAYLWWMGGTIVLCVRAYRREGRLAGPRPDVYLGVALGLVAFNLAGLFEDNWGDTEVQRLALFLLAAPWALEAPE